MCLALQHDWKFLIGRSSISFSLKLKSLVYGQTEQLFVILLVLDTARYFAEMILCTILQIDIRFICYHWIIYGCYNDLYWEVCARQITWFFNKIRLKVYSKHEWIHVWIILVSIKIEVSAAILCGKSWQHGNFFLLNTYASL